MINGFLNVLKPTGMSSSDVVVRARGILKRHFAEPIKAGHFGTLDPAGAGVLPVAIGRAARLFPYAQRGRKIYRAGFRFGLETDTLDSYGKVTKSSDILPNINEIFAVLPKLTGKIVQVPPAYSSILVGGRRAYDLARDGREVTLSGRDTEIYSITYVESVGNTFVFDIDCMGGTYIRSLVRDVAYELYTVGYMSYIIRLQSGCFRIEDAVTLDEIEANPEKYILPVEYFTDGFESFSLTGDAAEKVLNGVKLQFPNLPDGVFTVYANDALLGMGQQVDGCLRIQTRLL